MNDSYSAARIHVMRTRLIKPEEYERLMKVSAREIVNYLHTTDYREDIDALSLTELEDLEVIDKVIAHNTKRTMEKLRKIAGPEHTAALSMFLYKNDLWNLNVIADAIAGGMNPTIALANYGRKGAHDPAPFTAAKSIEELGKLASTTFPAFASKPKTLAAFHDIILSDHRDESFDRNFIDEENIIRIIMFKRDGLTPKEIIRRLSTGGTIRKSVLHAAANADGIAGALTVLRATSYANAIEVAQADIGGMVRFESTLHAEVLRRIKKETIAHPLHAALLLCYITEKDSEERNIRLLIKGRTLGLDEGFIRQHLAT